MSPEQLQSQATGQEVDARSDIFSFGLVLYEMLTGKRAFDGSSPATVIAGIMERPAPSIGEMAPAALDRLLKRCLEKDPENRWQNARDLKNELEWIAQAPVDGGRAPSSTERHLPLPWIAAVVLALVAAGASWIAYRATRPAELKPLVRLEVDLGHDVYLNALGGSDIVLSPDGTRIAYLSRNHLFTRTLDQLSATELTITPGATSPFFSPDGRWIGFVAGGKLRKVSVEGGTEIALCDATSSYTGADWGEEGIIIASLRVSGGLSRVPSNGGAPTPVTELEGEERTHRWPQILPGGKAILFTAENSTVGFDDANIEVVTLTDHRRKTLQHGGTYGRYLAASGGKGYLIFVSRNAVCGCFRRGETGDLRLAHSSVAAGFLFCHVWLRQGELFAQRDTDVPEPRARRVTGGHPMDGCGGEIATAARQTWPVRKSAPLARWGASGGGER
jgi:serine/threonine-protein kinase